MGVQLRVLVGEGFASSQAAAQVRGGRETARPAATQCFCPQSAMWGAVPVVWELLFASANLIQTRRGAVRLIQVRLPLLRQEQCDHAPWGQAQFLAWQRLPPQVSARPPGHRGRGLEASQKTCPWGGL